MILDKNQDIVRDVWLGYIDALSAMIGDKFKVAKSEEDIDRIRTNLLTAEEKQYVLWCYEKSGKFLPDPSMKLSDPEQYEKEIEYYTGSLARLGIELAYMGEMPKSKEVYQQAINLNSDQKTIVKLWGDYAEALQHIKANREAEEIYQRLFSAQRGR